MKNLESLIKKPACYKNHENSTCTDLILTNRLGYFQHSNVFETGITNSHVATQFKMDFKKKLPNIVEDHDSMEIGNVKFRDDVNNFILDQFDVCNLGETIFNIFDKHAPIKEKNLRGINLKRIY